MPKKATKEVEVKELIETGTSDNLHLNAEYDDTLSPEENAELVVIRHENKQRAMAAAYEGDNGLEGVDSADLIVPRISIGQTKTEEIPDDEIGFYRNSVSGECLKKMVVVPIIYKKTRTLMPEYEEGVKAKPLCKSENCITPDDIEGMTPMSASCKTCEYAKWGRKGSGKAKPPACAENHNFVMFDINPERFGPATMVMRVSSATVAKQIVTGLTMKSKSFNCPMWHLMMTLGVRENNSIWLPTMIGPVPLKVTPELEEMGIDIDFLKQTVTDCRLDMVNAQHDFELGAAGAETNADGGGADPVKGKF